MEVRVGADAKSRTIEGRFTRMLIDLARATSLGGRSMKRQTVRRTHARSVLDLAGILLGIAFFRFFLADAGATSIDDCNADSAPTAIEGCTAFLGEAIDPQRRVLAFIRRGEAYLKQRDLGSAVVDFIAALNIEPQNRPARADLDRVLPQSSTDTAIWPTLVEGIAFPRGFDPSVEQNTSRIGKLRYSFAPPSGDWRFCSAACFADSGCRTWSFSPSTKPAEGNAGSPSAACRLMGDVAAPVKAEGEVSGVIRPQVIGTDPPPYGFIDGEAFGLRPDTQAKMTKLSAAAFPSTGPYGVNPPNPHPMLNYYTAVALYRGPICEVSATGAGFRATSKTERVLRDLIAAFGRPALESTREKYVWSVNAEISKVTLEAGPRVNIQFKNYPECEAEERALTELQKRLGSRMPSDADLTEIFARWPPWPR